MRSTKKKQKKNCSVSSPFSQKTVWSSVVLYLAAQSLHSLFTVPISRDYEVQGLDYVLQSCTTGTSLLYAVYISHIFALIKSHFGTNFNSEKNKADKNLKVKLALKCKYSCSSKNRRLNRKTRRVASHTHIHTCVLEVTRKFWYF